MKDSIVITGATGFVGSNLTKYFLNLNYEVHLIVRPNSDLSNLNVNDSSLFYFRYDNDLNGLISFFKVTNPICTFHLASNFVAEHNSSQIDGLVTSNILFGLHLLEAMKEANARTLINTGTSWQHYNNEVYNLTTELKRKAPAPSAWPQLFQVLLFAFGIPIFLLISARVLVWIISGFQNPSQQPSSSRG